MLLLNTFYGRSVEQKHLIVKIQVVACYFSAKILKYQSIIVKMKGLKSVQSAVFILHDMHTFEFTSLSSEK